MTTTAIQNQPNLIPDQMMTDIWGLGIQTGVGSLAGLVFGIVNPIGGAIFGATFAISRIVARNITNALPIEEQSAKTTLRVASFILSTGIGIMATTYAGFAITALGALGMTFIIISTTFIIIAGGIIANALANANTQHTPEHPN